jgi:photosystem II stability/assembly factor-like uncharacterized protein
LYLVRPGNRPNYLPHVFFQVFFQFLKFIDQDQGILAGTFDGGVFRSADGGLTWRSISRALPNDSIRGIVLFDQGLIVATGNGIFKTMDKGKQWIPLNKGLTNLVIQSLIGSGGGSLYAGTSAGVFRSDDGLTWIAVNRGLKWGLRRRRFC